MHKPLGLNRGGYHGDRISIREVLSRMDDAARRFGWESCPLDFAPDGMGRIPAYRRLNTDPAPRVYISSGMHGDEPAGPLAMLRLLEEDDWGGDVSLWIAPCLNPIGFERNSRENELGLDLNRDYRAQRSSFVQSHIRWMQDLPSMNLGLLLHEDWESNGFYLYELNPGAVSSLAPAILESVAEVCPIDRSEVIEGKEAKDGLIAFVGTIPDREEWPEALYLVHHKCSLNYTLEGPSDFRLSTRVDALTHAVRAAVRRLV